MSCLHFRALLKKNLIILRRTYILTFFEIFTPIITLLVLLITNSKFETEHKPIILNKDYLTKNCTNISSNSDSSGLCQHKSFTCYKSIIVLIGENFPEEIKERLESHFFNGDYSFTHFRHYASFFELKDYIESENYENMTKVCFGISYQKLNQKYTFKLHYFASKFIKPEDHIFNIPSSNLDCLDPFRVKPDFDSYDLYINSGYLMVQKILYDYILKEETGNSNAEVSFNIVPEKYEEKDYNYFTEILNEIISVFILVAYAFPLCLNVYKLIKEKESRAKEIMKMMGLDEFSYFFSYFIIYFIINIIQALLNALISKEVMNYIEFKYLFILFFLYGLVIFSLIFFFQSFLDKANISIVFSLLVYAIFYTIGIPFKTNNISFAVKIILAFLFPPVNLCYGCNTLGQFQMNNNQFDGRISMDYNQFSVFDMYIIFILNFIFYMILGFYLQNVVEHQYGIKKPWNFLCTKKFWKRKNKEEEEKIKNSMKKSLRKSKINRGEDNNIIKINSADLLDDTNVENNNNNFDDDEVFHIKHIKKNFGEKKVLKDVNFKLYPDEIFVLLGHNGAGKTTLISILTGLITATSGSAIYNGYNILSPECSEYFRKVLGICPQHDVLFNDLTVEEHLELFCHFKSVEESKISEEINSVLKDIQLEDKRNFKASDLSGGQKRKLSIGLALVGGSSIIFLDEPSSGMDITSRRNLWDILKKCLAGKIIILTTHFMEEASVLGNKIGILSDGKMQCIGTPLELIEKYTNSVNLNITKHSDAKDDEIISYILQNFGDLDVYFETFNRDILFRIPTNIVNIDWALFFGRLDEVLIEYKIKSYSISKSTLEDVFINFNKINKKVDKNKNTQIIKKDKKNALKNSMLLFDENNYENREKYKSKFCKDFGVSFMKRILQIKRDTKTLILEIFCPILLTLIGCIVGYIEILEENKTFPLKLDQITNDSHVIYYNYHYLYNTLYSAFDYDQFKFSKDNVELRYNYPNYQLHLRGDEYILDDLEEYYKIKKNNNEKSYIYYKPILIDIVQNKYRFVLIIDITSRQAAPIYTDFLLNNVVTKVIENNYNKNIKIEIINEPFQYTYEEKNKRGNRNQFLIIFFIALAFSLIPSNFITIIIKEKENNSKHLQIISGISLFGYWFNNYIFELIKYYFIGGICILLLLAFDLYKKYLVILYLEYGPSMVSFTYVFSILLKTEYIGQISILLLNLILGCILAIAVITMRLYEKLITFADNLAYVLRIIPSFCFCYGYNQLIRKHEIYFLENKN